MAAGPRELRLLEIETARIRYAWAQDQITTKGPAPALLKYLKESLEELKVLRASNNG